MSRLPFLKRCGADISSIKVIERQRAYGVSCGVKLSSHLFLVFVCFVPTTVVEASFGMMADSYEMQEMVKGKAST